MMAVNHVAAILNVARVTHGVIAMQIATTKYLHLRLNEAKNIFKEKSQ
jgi:hypothetical protein